MREQIDVSLSDTRSLMLDELQAISDLLAVKTGRRIITSEEVNYKRAIKYAVDMIKAHSSFAPPGMQADEQKEATGAKKEQTSSRTTTRQNKTKGKCEESKKKEPDCDAAVSEDALESPTTCDPKPSTAQSIQRNTRRRPPNKRQDEPGDHASPAGDQKPPRGVGSGGKLKGCPSTCKGLDSVTVTREKRRPKGTAQRRVRVPKKRGQETNTDLQAESSEMNTENGNGHRGHKYLKHHMPDFEEEKGLSSSELSMEISSPECPATCTVSPSHDDTEEDVQLPVVVLQKEPAAIIPGGFVWCKFQHYPYWPSLVKLVDTKHKKVTVIFLEESISDPAKKKRSFKVALRSIKHYDCPEKEQLLEIARKDYNRSIDWCDSLISDYRIRLGCGSFSGSFMDYCTADISLPVRRELESGKRKILFPIISSEVAEAEQEVVAVTSPRNRKLLPDRARAARDRANEKLVEFIVSDKTAENHLLDILAGKKPSHWLKKFQSSNRGINCLETYIEDEEQMELVVGYLQTVCEKMSSATKKLMLGDQTQFIFEVLIPEAVIFAIAATEQMSHENAKLKYLKGPIVTKRERKIFEEQILEKKRSKLSEEPKIKKDSRK